MIDDYEEEKALERADDEAYATAKIIKQCLAIAMVILAILYMFTLTGCTSDCFMASPMHACPLVDMG